MSPPHASHGTYPPPFPDHDDWCCVTCAYRLLIIVCDRLYTCTNTNNKHTHHNQAYKYPHCYSNHKQHTRLGRAGAQSGDTPTSPYGKTSVEKPLAGKKSTIHIKKPLNVALCPATYNVDQESNICRLLCAQGSSTDKTHTVLPFGTKQSTTKYYSNYWCLQVLCMHKCLE